MLRRPRSLASQLPRGFLYSVAHSPLLVLLACLAGALLWFPLGGLGLAVSLLIGPHATAGVCALLFLLIGRLVARALVFPGSVTYLYRQIERESAGGLRRAVGDTLATLGGLLVRLGHPSLAPAGGAGLAAALSGPLRELRSVWRVLHTLAGEGSLSPHGLVLLHFLTLSLVSVELVQASGERIAAGGGGGGGARSFAACTVSLPLLPDLPPLDGSVRVVPLPHLLDGREWIGRGPSQGATGDSGRWMRGGVGGTGPPGPPSPPMATRTNHGTSPGCCCCCGTAAATAAGRCQAASPWPSPPRRPDAPATAPPPGS